MCASRAHLRALSSLTNASAPENFTPFRQDTKSHIADYIPMLGVLIGMLFFAEALTPSKAAGVALGLFGVAVLTRTGPVAFDQELLLDEPLSWAYLYGGALIAIALWLVVRPGTAIKAADGAIEGPRQA